MKVVLLSGGSGKRLWPLSNDVRSKQFLRVLQDEEGQMISMLERVWRQLDQLGLLSDTYLCASQAQIDVIQAQLGDVSVIVEPMRMDTFPAIALASTYLIREQQEDDIVIVAPVDQYVDPTFFKALTELPRALDESHADLALLGVKPRHVSNQFGYICVDQTNAKLKNSFQQVACFREKPDLATAKSLIDEGALWNCGVFCFRLSYMHKLLHNRNLPVSYREMVEHFADMPKRSFDYEVVEQAQSVVVVPYEGMWKDLGTWDALAPELDVEFVGQGLAASCENTHVINELGIPIVAKGIRDVIIVASPDGILVADKNQVADIKSIVKEISGRPMFEERRWGSYRVLDYQTLDQDQEVLTKYISLRSGANISYQKHALREEVWTIVSGHGQLALDGRIVPVWAGDVIRVCKGQWHAILAESELSFIEVQRGSELVEEDTVRRCLTWQDIMNHCAVVAR